MLQILPDILAKIVAHKEVALAGRASELPALEARAEKAIAERRSFRAALERQPPSIIAEIKKASPSKGLLSENFDPEALARQYQAGGAAALSVLTDRTFFQGSFADLHAARSATSVPVLRKDFTIAPLDVLEAAANHADAILLIAAILSVEELRSLRELAARYRMDALVEVHDEDELSRAIDAGAEILGVNNRDLRTFEVRIETSLRLAARMPSNVIRVSESGIHSAADVHRLQDAGFSAFLVGEHLMRSSDPAAALEALRR
jgi:indole-3-glycerol phosphate synthase